MSVQDGKSTAGTPASFGRGFGIGVALVALGWATIPVLGLAAVILPFAGQECRDDVCPGRTRLEENLLVADAAGWVAIPVLVVVGLWLGSRRPIALIAVIGALLALQVFAGVLGMEVFSFWGLVVPPATLIVLGAVLLYRELGAPSFGSSEALRATSARAAVIVGVGAIVYPAASIALFVGPFVALVLGLVLLVLARAAIRGIRSAAQVDHRRSGGSGREETSPEQLDAGSQPSQEPPSWRPDSS